MTHPETAGRAALLDACVLVPIRLATTLLWLAEAGLFELLWSEPILDEVQRNLPKVGISPDRAARRVGLMRDAFGTAALVEDFEHLIADMSCNEKDRHVLAAAVHGGASTLVTFNLKDFPPASTNWHDIEVVDPDLFLVGLLAQRPAAVLATLERACAALRKPPQGVAGYPWGTAQRVREARSVQRQREHVAAYRERAARRREAR